VASNMSLSESLAVANTVAREVWSEIMDGMGPGTSGLYTTTFPLDGGKTFDGNFLGPSGVIREFIGHKEYDVFRAYNYALTASMKHVSHEIPGIDWRHDRASVIERRIRNFLSTAPMAAIDKLITDSLVSNSGEGATCYDGTALINTSHPHGPSAGTQSNKTTSALTHVTFDSAFVAMTSFRAENGETLDISPTHLMVGPKLFKIATEITKSTDRIIAVDNAGVETGTRVAASTVTNVYGGGMVDLILNKRLVGTQDDYWYLMDLGKGDAKPMIYVEARAPEVISLTDKQTSESYFERDVVRFSMETDSAPGSGVWQTVYGGIL